MPPGVYVRRPCMKTYGKTAGKREEILEYLLSHSVQDAAKEFGISSSSVYKIKAGKWKTKLSA